MNLHKRLKRKIVFYLLSAFFKSEFWRKKQIADYLHTSMHPKLQIGCGGNQLSGWLNTDVSIKRCKEGAMFLNAGERFPLPDASMDFIFSEHLFEHLNFAQAVNMLKESYRVLKPSGVIRIATPNFDFLKDLYLAPETPLHKRYLEWSANGGGGGKPIPATPVYVINKFHTSWGHQIVYDEKTLSNLLKDCGFKNVRLCKMGESSHEELKGVERHGDVIPYDFCQLETMVLEADKASL
jgi:predicted SAM-dependent methyltransferase